MYLAPSNRGDGNIREMSDAPLSEATTMKYEPPSWDELFELAQRSIDASSGEPEFLISPETGNLMIALAAVKRCRRLMMGLIALIKADVPDVIGITLRTLYECWLVGIYALIGGEESLEALLHQRDFHMKKLVAVLGEETDEFDDGKNLPVFRMAERVTELLKERKHPNANFAINAYQTLYRFESYNSTHGGLGSIIGHIDENDERRLIHEVRPEDDAGIRHRFLTGIALLVSIGQMSAMDAGLPHEELDAVGILIVELDPRRTVQDELD